MYLIIHESGDAVTVSELKETDIAAANIGVVDIFHILADNYILRLNGDEFELVDYSGPDRGARLIKREQ